MKPFSAETWDTHLKIRGQAFRDPTSKDVFRIGSLKLKSPRWDLTGGEKESMTDPWWESWLYLGVTLVGSLNCVSFIRRHFTWQFSALSHLSSDVGPYFCFFFFCLDLQVSIIPGLNLYLLQTFDLWHQVWFTSSKIGTNCCSGPSLFTTFSWSFMLIALLRSSSRRPWESRHCHTFLLAMF